MSTLETIVKTKLDKLNLPYKETGNNHIMCECLSPVHNDKTPSFHISLETGYGGCFTCGFNISPDFFLKDTGLSEDDLESLERAQQYKALKDRLKRDEVGLTAQNLPIHSEDLEKYRGLNKKDLDRFGIYLCKRGMYSDRVIFPFYKEKIPVGFTSRTTLPDVQPKYLHNKGFNNKQTVYPYDVLKQTQTDYVVLVEGVLDCLSLWKLGIPSLCNFGVANNLSTNKVAFLLSLGVETIYISFDKDKAGQEAEESLINHPNLEWLKEEGIALNHGRKLKSLEDYYKDTEGDLNDYIQKLDDL